MWKIIFKTTNHGLENTLNKFCHLSAHIKIFLERILKMNTREEYTENHVCLFLDTNTNSGTDETETEETPGFNYFKWILHESFHVSVIPFGLAAPTKTDKVNNTATLVSNCLTDNNYPNPICLSYLPSRLPREQSALSARCFSLLTLNASPFSCQIIFPALISFLLRREKNGDTLNTRDTK